MLASYHALKAEVQCAYTAFPLLLSPNIISQLTKITGFTTGPKLTFSYLSYLCKKQPCKQLYGTEYFVNTNTRPRIVVSNRPVFCCLFLYYRKTQICT